MVMTVLPSLRNSAMTCAIRATLTASCPVVGSSKITMGEVIRHFDGILAPIGCVSVTGYERCSQEPVCKFRRVFLDARNYIAGMMDRATLTEVAKNLPVAKREVSMGFIGGEGI